MAVHGRGRRVVGQHGMAEPYLARALLPDHEGALPRVAIERGVDVEESFGDCRIAWLQGGEQGLTTSHTTPDGPVPS